MISFIVRITRRRLQNLLILNQEILVDKLQALQREVIASDGVAEKRRPVAGGVTSLAGIKSSGRSGGRSRALSEVAGDAMAGSDVEVSNDLRGNGIRDVCNLRRRGVQRRRLGCGDRVGFLKLSRRGGKRGGAAHESEIEIDLVFGGNPVLNAGHKLVAGILVTAPAKVKQSIRQVVDPVRVNSVKANTVPAHRAGGLECEEEIEHALEIEGRAVVP